VPYEAFAKCPGSFGGQALGFLLGPLLKKNFSAVVLNARDGSEMALMVEAGMKVVGVYSQHHDKFPGGAVPDSKKEFDALVEAHLEEKKQLVTQ
jgi:hypothetical protein